MGETDRSVVVAGGNGQGNRLDQFNAPYYIYVDEDHSIYISDNGNHRVMKWLEGEKEGFVVAGNQGEGDNVTQLAYSDGIIVDQMGTIYVTDKGNHRVMHWFKGTTNPCDLSFDRHNNLYVVDYNNIEYRNSISNQIQIVNC